LVVETKTEELKEELEWRLEGRMTSMIRRTLNG
jgi:hypothetical protein